MRAARAARQRGCVVSLWWLSFCDPDKPEGSQFLGVALVEGSDAVDAVKQAHRLQCNPGGEVCGVPAPDAIATRIAPEWRDRLLSKQETIALDRLLSSGGAS
jgi:hypothetical protein